MLHHRMRGPAVLVLSLALATGSALAQERRFTVDDLIDLTNASLSDVTRDGKFAVVTTAALRDRIGSDNARFGDPSYIAPSRADVWIVETATGKSTRLFSDKRQLRGFRWSPDGARLAFAQLVNGRFEPMIWERASGKTRALKLPADKMLADGDMQWSDDGRTLLLPLRNKDWTARAQSRFAALTRDSIIVQSSSAPFLAWDDLGRLRLEQSLASYDLATDRIREVLPTRNVRSYQLTSDGSIVFQEDITKKTDYDVIGGNDNQLFVAPATGGEARRIMASTKGLNLQWSADGSQYVYAKDGAIYIGTTRDTAVRKIIGPTSKDTAAARNERFTVSRLSGDGRTIVASNREGLWLVDAQSGARELIVRQSEDDKEGVRYSVADISENGQHVYLTSSARTKWERGIARFDRASKQLRDLVKDARLYSGVRLSRDGSTLFYTRADGNRPSQLFVADTELREVRPLVETHAQVRDLPLSRTALVDYLDVDGKKTYGVLYYPANYELGKRYPVIFNIYETFFDDSFNSTINVLTANGYAVMQPSVNLEIGFPGEAWTKGVTAAANKLIEMGIADPDRLGVQGTSYGGYATNLLITQTDRFKAAINISGKVDMISFYTDSPRLGVRNIHAPEKSQDRLGATLWQAPQKYIEHSAIFAADRIKTPLLLITGREDHNVPERTTLEMFYALRRLGKEVEWVSYTYGGHGMPTTSVEAVRDYHNRILGWYDKHLKNSGKRITDQ